LRKKIISRAKLIDVFDAVDPGFARSKYALRATLAMFVSWMIIFIIDQQLNLVVIGLGIFTIIASFLCNSIMAQSKADKRIATLVTTLVVMFAATGLVALSNRNILLYLICVVSIFFLANYAQKYSSKLQALGFMAVVSFFFGWIYNMSFSNIGYFFLAIVVAALTNLLFWSILLPSRPLKAIGSAIKSYYLRSAVILSSLSTDLGGEGTLEQNGKRSRRQLRRLERSMRMIENIVPEVLDERSQADQSEVIRTNLFSTARAIRIISSEVEGLVNTKSTLGPPMTDLASSLMDVSAWLRKGAPQDDRDRLTSALNERLKAITSLAQQEYDKSHASLLRITAGLLRVVEGAGAIKTLAGEVRSGSRKTTKDRRTKQKSEKIPSTVTTKIWGREISIPSLMAFQALTASFLAVGIGYALGVSQLYLTFWFALVTVSGSLGETWLKSFSRIIGTILGVVVGSILAFLVMDTAILIAVAVLIVFFLVEFSRTISLNLFILFFTMMMVLALTGAGADPIVFSTILLECSMIGVGAALVTTTLIFPIRIQNRYYSALSQYLMSINVALHAYLASPERNLVGIPEESLKSQEGAYNVLERVSEVSLIESNPFSSLDRDRSYEMTTILESLNDAVMKLGSDPSPDRATMSPPPTIIESIVEVIGRNIASIEAYLKDSRTVPSVDSGGDIVKEWMENRVGKSTLVLEPPYRRDIFPLLDIHDFVQGLAKSLIKRD
jgi:uncharacterized membrane protein YccC